jgi:hypothetical protein
MVEYTHRIERSSGYSLGEYLFNPGFTTPRSVYRDPLPQTKPNEIVPKSFEFGRGPGESVDYGEHWNMARQVLDDTQHVSISLARKHPGRPRKRRTSAPMGKVQRTNRGKKVFVTKRKTGHR